MLLSSYQRIAEIRALEILHHTMLVFVICYIFLLFIYVLYIQMT